MTIIETFIQLRDDIKTWVTNNLVALNEKVDKIEGFSGDYNDLKNKPDILEDSSDSLNVVDQSGNVILKVDENGLATTHVEANTMTLNGQSLANVVEEVGTLNDLVGNKAVSTQIEDAINSQYHFSGDYNDLANKPDILEDGSDSFVVADSFGNIILEVDESGLSTTHVKAQSVILDGQTFTGDYEELTNKPNVLDDGSGSFVIADEEGNVVLEVDESGLNTTTVAAKSVVIDGVNAATEAYVDGVAGDLHAKMDSLHRIITVTDGVADITGRELFNSEHARKFKVAQQLEYKSGSVTGTTYRYYNITDITIGEMSATGLEIIVLCYCIENDVICQCKLHSDAANPDGFMTATFTEINVSASFEEVDDKFEAISSLISTHAGNIDVHVTTDDKTRWNNINNILDDSSGALNITDESGNIIMTVDENGLNTTALSVRGVNIQSSFDKKVDKIEGKGLSTEDFTTAEKDKLAGLDAELAKKSDVGHDHDDVYYTETEIDDKLSNKSDVGHIHNDIYYTKEDINDKLSPVVSHIGDGDIHVSTDDKTRWNNINNISDDGSGTLNITDGLGNIIMAVDESGLNTTDVLIKGVSIQSTINQKADSTLASAKEYANDVKNDLLNGAGGAYDTLKELGDLIDVNVNAIDALEQVAASKASSADLTDHTTNKSNPHGVTLSQLGVNASTDELNKLDGVTATTTEINYLSGVTSKIQTQLNSKVKQTDFDTHTSDTTIHITAAERTKWNNKSTFSGDYNDLTNAPDIKEDGSGNLVIADPNGNIIFRSDGNGFETTTLSAQSLVVDGVNISETIEQHEAKLNTIAEGANKYVHPTPSITRGTGTSSPKHGGQFNAIGSIAVNDSGHITSYTRTTYTLPTYDAATPSAAGLMSVADKIKLDGVEEGANKYVHPVITRSNSQYTGKLSYGKSFSAIQSVVVDDSGHVTEYLPATYKMPDIPTSVATATLTSSNWAYSSNIYTQDVTVTGVTATNLVTVSPVADSWVAAGDCCVRCTAQATDTLTFVADDKPSGDLTFNVAIQEVR